MSVYPHLSFPPHPYPWTVGQPGFLPGSNTTLVPWPPFPAPLVPPASPSAKGGLTKAGIDEFEWTSEAACLLHRLAHAVINGAQSS